MKRLTKLLTLIVILVLLTSMGAFSQVTPPSYVGFPCMIGYGKEISGIGPRSQTILQYRLFMSRFHSQNERDGDGRLVNFNGGCREDVQSQIFYTGASEDVIFRSMLSRANDNIGRAFRFYGLNRPLSETERKRVETECESLRSTCQGYDILHIPFAVDALAIVYNLDCPTGNPGDELRLSSAALNGIFNGLITNWNDGTIALDNRLLGSGSGVGCNVPIQTAVRAEASEQTIVFKDYMSKRNPAWRSVMESSIPGVNTQWPSGLPAPCRGFEELGLSNCVQGQLGSVGYVSYSVARQEGLKIASVENRSHDFVQPSLEACTEAAGPQNLSANVPNNGTDAKWSETSLTDPIDQTPGTTKMYAICSFQFALAGQTMNNFYFRQNPITGVQVRTVQDYIRWMVLPATQARLVEFQLAKLPNNVRATSEASALSIRY